MTGFWTSVSSELLNIFRINLLTFIVAFPLLAKDADPSCPSQVSELQALHSTEDANLYHRRKRLFDKSLVIVSLPVSGLLILGAAIALKVEGWMNPQWKGPVFFRQVRVGKDGEDFEIVKLRTMVAHAEQAGPLYTQHGDRRITPVGRILRRLKIDEVPQLVVNVLVKGNMSLVGPRPLAKSMDTECRLLSNEWVARDLVLPGLTGQAQIHMSHAKTVSEQLERLSHDLDGIEKISIQEDLKTLLKTIFTVLKGRVCP